MTKNVTQVNCDDLMASLCEADDVSSVDMGAYSVHFYSVDGKPVIAIENPSDEQAQLLIS